MEQLGLNGFRNGRREYERKYNWWKYQRHFKKFIWKSVLYKLLKISTLMEGGPHLMWIKKAVDKLEVLKQRLFSSMEETDTCSPRRLERVLCNNLATIWDSVEPGFTWIPQTPENYFSVNRAQPHAYYKPCLPGPSPEHFSYISRTCSRGRGHRCLAKEPRSVMLKLSCQEETFLQSCPVLKYVKNKHMCLGWDSRSLNQPA